MKIILFCLCVVIFNCASKRKEAQTIEYIIFGTYCGECVGQCATMYRIDNTSIKVDTTNNFFSEIYGFSKNEAYAFTGHTYHTDKDPKAFFDQVKSAMPDDFIDKDGATYGSPDAYDQCGVYIELKNNGKVRKFYIDTNEEETPNDIEIFVNMLYELVNKPD